MNSIIDGIRATPDCLVHPPMGLPTIQEGYILPDDLRAFYQLCGGVELFQSASFPVSVSSPNKLVVANRVILVGVTEEELADPDYDFSRSWYIIAEVAGSEYITIDLSPQRLGYCYDSFWDIHPFNSTIISKSFTVLLSLLLANRGQRYRSAFPSLGDAY